MENKFKDVLKEIRLEKNVSQVKLAEAIGVSKGIISMWETGQREPTLSSLVSLADYFGVSLDYLVGREQ
ncbi:MAG: helix-turn-helix transcriptional regulator [Clostridiales bacterium]|nr:helix-turn-helix transcriptional regulator [Clostridiales bacterium]